jgi:hypothetical protein
MMVCSAAVGYWKNMLAGAPMERYTIQEVHIMNDSLIRTANALDHKNYSGLPGSLMGNS